METYFHTRSAGYFAEDIGRKIGTLDSRNRTLLSYRFRDADNVWDAPVQRAAADAHSGASMMKDYLQTVHGRNGLDGLGGPGTTRSRDGVTRLISSRVHYGSNYNNAFFNGLYMYSERYRGPADNGGVHINSGIANKAFYLVSECGSHHLGGTMTGIGADKTGQIWYRAVTTYMTVLTRFAGARTATLNAAGDLYGQRGAGGRLPGLVHGRRGRELRGRVVACRE